MYVFVTYYQFESAWHNKNAATYPWEIMILNFCLETSQCLHLPCPSKLKPV